MKCLSAEVNNRQFFTLLGVFFLGLAFLGIILAMLGIFYGNILAIYIILGLVFLIYLAFKNRQNLVISRNILAIILISLGFILLFSIFTTPTIFSGRDQGSYGEAAIRLSQNHQLEFSTPASQEFFRIYGPGKALNFPGFNYTSSGNLITQFPLGYISWLAVFYSLFGLDGLIVANAVSFFIFLISFYLLAKTYLSKTPLIISYLLLITSFVFSWFFRFTLSENLALMLIWFGILQLIMFLKHKDNLHFIAFILSFGALIFVRIEAWSFLFIIATILAIKYKNRYSQLFSKPSATITAIIALFFLISLKINSAFYISFLKGFLKSVENPIQASTNPFFSIIYVWKVLNTFSLLPSIILAILGLIYFLKKKQYDLLIPFFIVIPTFIYLIHPGISDDYPWMLRRFLFSIAPVCILYAVIFLDRYLHRKYVFYAISTLLIFSNLLIFMLYFTVSENSNLLPQIETISTNFTAKDLVLVDQKATGDGWSMMTGPLSFLYGKQAVYFINPADIDKINSKRFGQIYFIIPDDNLSLYEKSGLMDRLQPVKDYAINTYRLDVKTSDKSSLYSQPIELPTEKNIIASGKIYLLR
jgi:hypothetical protein